MRAALLPSVVGFALCALLGAGLIRASGPTYDEPVHLAAGYTDLVRGCCRLNTMDHPPLAEMWAALPLLALRPDTFPAHPDWLDARVYHYGDLFLFRNKVPAARLLSAARLFNLLTLSALLSFLLCRWARRLDGAPASVGAALALGACAPWHSNAALVTTDAASAALFFAAFAVLSERPRPAARWALAGALAGAALAAKFNMILLPPLMAVCLLAEARVDRTARPQPLGPALAALAAALTLAACYGFGSAGLWWKGLTATLARLSEGRSAFLLGRHSIEGWWWYFPAALLVKTPLALLAAAGVGAWSARRLPRAELAWLLLPPTLYLGAALTSKTQIGYRHVLPVYPFLVLLAGLGGAALWRRGAGGRAAALGLAAWGAFAALRAHPHHLAYFNELAALRGGGAAWLADSNLDWGQDLPALAAELKARGNPVVVLSYFGSDNPAAAGLRFVPLATVSSVARPGNAALEPGAPVLLAVSQTNRAAVYYRDKALFSWLATRSPVAAPGGSIFLYDLTADGEGRSRLAALLAASGRPGDAKTAMLH
ncbi:MAG: glycosyltransferase family 39 protein [Elusimicrobiota bacterium]|nr:glycosyltransferase family 39 protein [Elusimicrobiota bacterium]